jgi:uncharacterized protein (TIGR02646 family)
MHKLARTLSPAPVCLAAYDYRHQPWTDLDPGHKQQIRFGLEQLQDVRCAYCEGPVYSDGHIEHFRRKNQGRFPHLMFDWDNLFLSCGAHDHCGHYKDRPAADPYDPNDLVKPDDNDPDDYFYFHSWGDVRPRPNLSQNYLNRALETIRVFNLNCGVLAADRRRAIRTYRESHPAILDDLMAFEESDRQEFIAAEIQATRCDPHWTVIRHYFEKVC